MPNKTMKEILADIENKRPTYHHTPRKVKVQPPEEDEKVYWFSVLFVSLCLLGYWLLSK